MLKVIVWDVQHGNAVYIRTPNGKHIVVDLGTGSYTTSHRQFSPLMYLRDRWQVWQLDGVVVTHPHKDHLDDVFAFDQLQPRVFVRPRHLTEAAIREGNPDTARAVIAKYLEIDRRYGCPVAVGSDPFATENNGGVDVRMFTPSCSATSNLNNHSVVLVLSYAGCKMIIPGDNESPSWNELLEKVEFIRAVQGADVLLAPHHGREQGFPAGLFQHFKPRLIVVSDGRFCDTSATSRYTQVSTGWAVHKRGGGQEQRYCVTTRKDGVIELKFGLSPNANPFIEAWVN